MLLLYCFFVEYSISCFNDCYYHLIYNLREEFRGQSASLLYTYVFIAHRGGLTKPPDYRCKFWPHGWIESVAFLSISTLLLSKALYPVLLHMFFFFSSIVLLVSVLLWTYGPPSIYFSWMLFGSMELLEYISPVVWGETKRSIYIPCCIEVCACGASVLCGVLFLGIGIWIVVSQIRRF